MPVGADDIGGTSGDAEEHANIKPQNNSDSASTATGINVIADTMSSQLYKLDEALLEQFKTAGSNLATPDPRDGL